MHNKAGFTLVEILTAVVIVTILVVMAMPLYEKTIERSHLAEARTILAKLQEAKIQAMDNMGCSSYSTTNTRCPLIKHLNIAFSATPKTATTFQTKDFEYTLVSPTYPNAVCAKRRNGDYAGTLFVYQGSIVDGDNTFLYCNGPHCEDYGFGNDSFTCTF